MKIIAVCGSPRKGNTEFMLNTVLDAVKGEKELILLRESNIKHCNGCSICQKTNKCTIEDDMADLLKKMDEADTIVLGSPTYFDDVTGLMKDFIDRCHPLYKTKELKSKKIAICVIGAGGKESVERTAQTLELFSGLMEANVIEKACITGNKVKESTNRLKQLGEKLG